MSDEAAMSSVSIGTDQLGGIRMMPSVNGSLPDIIREEYIAKFNSYSLALRTDKLLSTNQMVKLATICQDMVNSKCKNSSAIVEFGWRAREKDDRNKAFEQLLMIDGKEYVVGSIHIVLVKQAKKVIVDSVLQPNRVKVYAPTADWLKGVDESLIRAKSFNSDGKYEVVFRKPIYEKIVEDDPYDEPWLMGVLDTKGVFTAKRHC